MLSKEFVEELNKEIKDFSKYFTVTEKGLVITQNPSHECVRKFFDIVITLQINYPSDVRQILFTIDKYVDMTIENIEKELEILKKFQ